MVAMLTAKFKIKSSTYCSHSFCVFSVCVCVCVSVCVCVCMCVTTNSHYIRPLVSPFGYSNAYTHYSL